MLNSGDRREAVRQYKEQAIPAGVFAVRCTASSKVWVGASQNLSATKNRFWFTLRNGSHPDRALQSEWNAHGEAAFTYEILEELDEDTPQMAIRDELKRRTAEWQVRLSAALLN